MALITSWGNKLLIVIPTYNEKLTIRRVVEEIFKLYPMVNVCIVDDNSPDGTAEEAQRLIENYIFVFVDQCGNKVRWV